MRNTASAAPSHPAPHGRMRADAVLEHLRRLAAGRPGGRNHGRRAPTRLPTAIRWTGLGSLRLHPARISVSPHPCATTRRTDTDDAPSFTGLPDNLRGLLELALAVPEESETRTTPRASSEIRKLGKISLRHLGQLGGTRQFTGQSVLSLGRLFTGKARFRSSDFWMTLQECGVEALPIVSLISFLIGADSRLRGQRPAHQLRRQSVRRGSRRHRHGPRNGRGHDGHHHERPHRRRLRRPSRQHEGQRGDRRPAHLRVRSLRFPRPAPLAGAGADDAAPHDLSPTSSASSAACWWDRWSASPPELYWTETRKAVDLTNASLGVIKSVFFGAAIAISGCMQGMKAGQFLRRRR